MARDGKERLLLDPNKIILALLLFFLPTQLGIHFWPEFSYVRGLRVDYLSPTLYFIDFLILVFIYRNIKNIQTEIRKIKISKNLKLIFSLIFVFTLGSVFFSAAPLLGALKIVRILEYMLLGISIIANQKLFLDLIPKIIPLSVFFQVFLAAAQFLNKGSINGIFYFLGERFFTSQTPNIANASILGELILRPYGTLPHPNVLAGFLLISVAIMGLYKNFGKEFIARLGIIIGAAGIFLSMSRVSIILFLFLILVFFAKRKKDIMKLIIGAIVVFLFFTPVRERFVFELHDSSFTQRQQLMEASLKMIKDNPLFGVGLNNFLPSLPIYDKPLGNIFYIQPVHNIPLLIISEIGIIAGGLMFYLLFILFKKTKSESKILLIIVFAISMLDHYFLTTAQGQLLLTIILVLSFINTNSPKDKFRRNLRGKAYLEAESPMVNRTAGGK